MSTSHINKMARTQKSFDEKVKRLNSSSKKTAPKKPVKKTSTSTKITIIQSRKKDLFPHMGIAHKFPYYFEPMPEIADRLNRAWFDQYFGEERMIEHIKRHKLKSHQYKAYVNYWWLKEQK